jgi:hypothetical protein
MSGTVSSLLGNFAHLVSMCVADCCCSLRMSDGDMPLRNVGYNMLSGSLFSEFGVLSSLYAM